MSTELIDVEVVNKRAEAKGIVSFELAAINGQPLPEFTPGAHIDLVLPNGLIRQYSLYAFSPSPKVYKIAVLHEPQGRGGSEYVHTELEVGSRLAISHPRNQFELVDANKYLLLAGGIGVTPILCMASKLLSDNANFTMHYCCRSRDRMAFHDAITSSSLASHVKLHIDEESSQPAFNPDDVFAQPDQGTHLFVCGPKGFMDFVISTAKAKGWPDSHIHYEFFSGVEATPEDADSFEIQLASCGSVIPVKSDQTVLEVLRQTGIEVPVSCEQGICGTCTTKVLDGVPDHRDLFLTDAERASNTLFTPCCSRSKSARLVLDL